MYNVGRCGFVCIPWMVASFLSNSEFQPCSDSVAMIVISFTLQVFEIHSQKKRHKEMLPCRDSLICFFPIAR